MIIISSSSYSMTFLLLPAERLQLDGPLVDANVVPHVIRRRGARDGGRENDVSIGIHLCRGRAVGVARVTPPGGHQDGDVTKHCSVIGGGVQEGGGFGKRVLKNETTGSRAGKRRGRMYLGSHRAGERRGGMNLGSHRAGESRGGMNLGSHRAGERRGGMNLGSHRAGDRGEGMKLGSHRAGDRGEGMNLRSHSIRRQQVHVPRQSRRQRREDETTMKQQ